PLADAEHDGPAGCLQRVPHGGVGAVRPEVVAVAPVVLQIVDVPLRVSLRILILAAATAGVASARLGARIRVDAQPEPLGMDVISQGFDARGELLRVGPDKSLAVAFPLPAI